MGRVVYTDQSGREHSVMVGPDNPVVSIGRATDCTIRSSKKSVSRHHAEVRWEEGGCEVVDLDSSNGTYIIVNGERQPVLSPEELSHNDELWCGDFILYFYEDQPEEHRSGGQDQVSSGGSLGGPRAPGGNLPGPSGDLSLTGGAFDAPEGENNSPLERERSHDSYDDVEPDVIEEVEDDPYNRIDRLREEKESVEDLASRQAKQIEDLQEQLENARGGGGGAEVDRLREKLDEFEEDNEYLREDVRRLTDERDEARERLEELEQEVDDLEKELDRVLSENDRLREKLDEADELKSKLDERNRKLESLERENEHLERQLEQLEADAERADEANRQVQELKDEIQRRQDLIDDLEIDNAGFREQLEKRDREIEEMSVRLEERQEDIDELRERAETLVRERDGAQKEAEDLEQEIQGLKQRLALKRSEQKDAQRRRQRLEEENENLREQLEALQNGEEGQPQMVPETTIADNMLSEVRNRAEKLHRMVDAIKRTDLEQLSTVDRIRLESAIRETTPQENLEELLELIGAKPPETAESEAE